MEMEKENNGEEESVFGMIGRMAAFFAKQINDGMNGASFSYLHCLSMKIAK